MNTKGGIPKSLKAQHGGINITVEKKTMEALIDYVIAEYGAVPQDPMWGNGKLSTYSQARMEEIKKMATFKKNNPTKSHSEVHEWFKSEEELDDAFPAGFTSASYEETIGFLYDFVALLKVPPQNGTQKKPTDGSKVVHNFYESMKMVSPDEMKNFLQPSTKVMFSMTKFFRDLPIDFDEGILAGINVQALDFAEIGANLINQLNVHYTSQKTFTEAIMALCAYYLRVGLNINKTDKLADVSKKYMDDLFQNLHIYAGKPRGSSKQPTRVGRTTAPRTSGTLTMTRIASLLSPIIFQILLKDQIKPKIPAQCSKFPKAYAFTAANNLMLNVEDDLTKAHKLFSYYFQKMVTPGSPAIDIDNFDVYYNLAVNGTYFSKEFKSELRAYADAGIDDNAIIEYSREWDHLFNTETRMVGSSNELAAK